MRTEKNEFDSQIGKILSDAREEVPGRLWEGVCARMDAKASRGAWVFTARRIGYGLLAAAAAVALLLTIPGLLDSGNNADTYTKDYSLAEATTSEPAVIFSEDVAEAASESSDADTPVVHAGGAQPEPEAVQPSPVVASVAPVVATEAPATLLAEAKPAEKVVVEQDVLSEVSEPVAEAVAASEPVATQEPVAGKDEADDESAEDEHHFGKKIGITIGGNRQNNGISSTGAPTVASGGIRRAAVSLPKESSVSETDQSTYMMPLTFGLGVHIPISNVIGVSTGLSYTFLHRNFGGTYTRVADGEVSRIESDDIDHNIHYLGVPLGLYFTIYGNENKVRLYGFTSGMIERAISNKYVIHTPGKAYTLTKKLDGFQFSVAAGFGLEYRISNHFGIYLDPSIRYYFDCDQPKSIRTQQPWMMGLELGVRFNL
nr:outer membrane beta-barrel protein [Bacteroidales bacterium]